MKRSFWFRCLALPAALALMAQAQALEVVSVSPQGEVARVRQVVIKFKTDAVAFGNAQAAAPFAVSCDDAEAQKGVGRWESAREWVYDFEDDLPPGVRCALKPVAEFKSVAGTALKGKGSYTFGTGGPVVSEIFPRTWQDVDEEQYFVLALNGAAAPASVRENVWCEVEGVGERVPVQLVEGDARATLIDTLNLQRRDEKMPGSLFVLQCQRRFAPGGKVQLVYGKGVRTASGVANGTERRFEYEVRLRFTANMSCERENAQAACMPLRAVKLEFSSSVPRSVLAQARLTLKSGKGEGDAARVIQPRFNEEDGPNAVLDQLEFPAPLVENATYELTLPADLKDDSGRALANAGSFPLTVKTAPMPPLAKFAAGAFGIVERFADGPKSTPLLPVTLRRVEADLAAQSLQISRMQLESDADIIEWQRRVYELDDTQMKHKPK